MLGTAARKASFSPGVAKVRISGGSAYGRVETGMLSINTSSSVHIEAPFSGVKQSGIGRDQGVVALEELELALEDELLVLDDEDADGQVETRVGHGRRSGREKETRVPAPGAESTSRVAPSFMARSCMLSRP